MSLSQCLIIIYISGVKAFKRISGEIRLPDDMTVGFIIGCLLIIIITYIVI